MAQRVFTRDPDGHLIELSWDRPREDWPPNWRDPESLSGSATLDIESLLREAWSLLGALTGGWGPGSLSVSSGA